MNALNNANINDENSKGFDSFAFPEAKSSQPGVSVRYVPSLDKHWYVFLLSSIGLVSTAYIPTAFFGLLIQIEP